MEYCDVCEVPTPTRKMHVRGLCSASLFDRDYTYVINENGKPMFLGYRSSVIFYDEDVLGWVWYDRKDNRSVAISQSPETSLFVGVHEVDARDAMVFGVLVLLPGKRSRLRIIDKSFDFAPHSLLRIFLGSHVLLV